MKLVSWNCNMAFRRKLGTVREMEPDVMLIQECEAPSTLQSCLGDEYRMFWTGENTRKGLGVFVRRSIAAEQLEVDTGTVRHMLSVRIGDVLNLIVFWAMDDRRDVAQRYIGQVWTGLHCCEDLLSGPTIVAGDFNWNVGFDHSFGRETLCGTMGDVISFLLRHGIVSAYHVLKKAEYGGESDSTFFMHRCDAKAYHTDYVFLSEQMIGTIVSFGIGNFVDWITLSDHMPLVIDIGD